MIAYHCDSNSIIAVPFKSHTDKHRLMAYGAIMKRLKEVNMLVDLQILDNEASAEYKRIIKAEWGVEYQQVGSIIPTGTTPHPSYKCSLKHVFSPY